MMPSPTLSLQAAATRRWDVAVVGAGPAGALAAYEMATRGYSVLLIDKAAFPRGKVCGSCLNGQALAALHGAGLGTLTQGFLEMSNVKVVDEMVAMITSQRAYEANSKAIQTADEMLTIANNLRR